MDTSVAHLGALKVAIQPLTMSPPKWLRAAMGDLDDAQGATEGNCLRVLTGTVAAARPKERPALAPS